VEITFQKQNGHLKFGGDIRRNCEGAGSKSPLYFEYWYPHSYLLSQRIFLSTPPIISSESPKFL